MQALGVKIAACCMLLPLDTTCSEQAVLLEMLTLLYFLPASHHRMLSQSNHIQITLSVCLGPQDKAVQSSV